MGSCNTLNDLSHNVCYTDEIEGLNLSVFNIMTGKSITLLNFLTLP